MPTVAEIVSGLRAGSISQEEGEELVQAAIDGAVAQAIDRDEVAVSVLSGMLAGRVDTNIDSLIDKAYLAADKVLVRRLQ